MDFKYAFNFNSTSFFLLFMLMLKPLNSSDIDSFFFIYFFYLIFISIIFVLSPIKNDSIISISAIQYT